MPKKRSSVVTPIESGSIEEKVKKFADQADGGKPEALDPNAKRDFKEIRLPLNEYEFRMLDEGAKKSGRSRLNFIRWAISQACTE